MKCESERWTHTSRRKQGAIANHLQSHVDDPIDAVALQFVKEPVDGLHVQGWPHGCLEEHALEIHESIDVVCPQVGAVHSVCTNSSSKPSNICTGTPWVWRICSGLTIVLIFVGLFHFQTIDSAWFLTNGNDERLVERQATRSNYLDSKQWTPHHRFLMDRNSSNALHHPRLPETTADQGGQVGQAVASAERFTQTKVRICSGLIALALLLGLTIGKKTLNLGERVGNIAAYHLVYLVPLVLLVLINRLVLGAIWEEDLTCNANRWLPMVPFIAQAYLPWLGTGDEIRNTLLSHFKPIMLLNIFDRAEPGRLVPALDEPHMTPLQSSIRREFFVPNFLAVTALVILGLEVFHLMCHKGPKIWQFVRSSCKKDGGGSDSKKQPLLGKVLAHAPVKDTQATDTVSRDDVEIIDEDDGGSTLKDRTSFDKKKLCYFVAFGIYYCLYQAFLYVWVDIMVAGGLMNLKTGLAWEMWSFVLLFELIIATAQAVVRYLSDFGVKQQSPAMLVLPGLMPVMGNAVHVLKDHVSTGLCFTMARCSDGTLSRVGYILGYASFVATVVPIVTLLVRPHCREGLRAAHWQIAEALPSQTPFSKKEKGIATPEGRKQVCMDQIIGSCTEEKRVRALWGEVPHTALHILFVFFYGGSPFMYFGILLSAIKVFSIPVVFNLFVEPNIETWHCSVSSAAKFLVSGGSPSKVYRLAIHNHWYNLLNEFYDFEIPTGRYYGPMNYPDYGDEYELCMDFSEVEWLDDAMTRCQFVMVQSFVKMTSCPPSEGRYSYEVMKGHFNMKTRRMEYSHCYDGNGQHQLGWQGDPPPNLPIDQVCDPCGPCHFVLKDGIIHAVMDGAEPTIMTKHDDWQIKLPPTA